MPWRVARRCAVGLVARGRALAGSRGPDQVAPTVLEHIETP